MPIKVLVQSASLLEEDYKCRERYNAGGNMSCDAVIGIGSTRNIIAAPGLAGPAGAYPKDSRTYLDRAP